MKVVLLIPLVIISASLVSSVQTVAADLLSNSLQQRIGDYDVQINTIPMVPISGQATRINIMMTTVSNIPITDTPIIIRISNERQELARSQPILLSSGHYSYYYNFDKSGLFLLSIDILENPLGGDSNGSNRILTFDFPIRVSEPFSVDMANLALPIIIAAAVGSVGSFIVLKKLKKSKNIT
ncbi:MAG TPA: hypothetical protein VE548_11955 [Nitrososphaeraceae archaeon]|nr:hypothetical protein [Nitrososphaeraceae archaeon]